MNYLHYQDFVMSRAKPGKDILEETNPDQIHLLHMAVGLMGEVVELEFHEDEENFWEELGDLEFYFAGLLKGLGLVGDGGFVHAKGVETESTLTSEGDALTVLRFHAGEILDKTKKMTVYQKDVKPDAFMVHADEIRHCLWWLCHINGKGCEEVRQENYDKLIVRYPEGYSNSDANERKDKK